MTPGLEKTFQILGNSRNEAATDVLIATLESPVSHIRQAALKALIARRSSRGHAVVIGKWHQLSSEEREYLQQGRGRMTGGLRKAILSGDDQLFINACEVIEQFDEFDLLPTLIPLAEDRKHSHAKPATKLILRQVGRLSEIIYGERDSSQFRNPETIRRFLLESLERSLERFRNHQRTELVEAFVVLGSSSNDTLNHILDDPHHPCYLSLVETMRQSLSVGVINLLVSLLHTENPPPSALNVISHRSDPQFFHKLLELADQLGPEVKKNLAKLKSLDLLAKQPQLLQLDGEDQARCVKLISALGADSQAKLGLLELILKHGHAQGRLAAVEALQSISGERANKLVQVALEDEDPQVQAAAALQLRDRHVSGAMTLLLKCLDSPHQEVREAGRRSLSEFSFENLISRIGTLDDETLKSTAALVKRVDTDATEKLRAHLKHDSRKFRLRGIEIADLMSLIHEVHDTLVELLDDDDHLVRASAAEALHNCPTAEVQEALRYALTDKSRSVQLAAQSSLEAMDALPEKFVPDVSPAPKEQS